MDVHKWKNKKKEKSAIVIIETCNNITESTQSGPRSWALVWIHLFGLIFGCPIEGKGKDDHDGDQA